MIAVTLLRRWSLFWALFWWMLCVNLYVKMMSFKIYTAWVVLFNHLSANPTKWSNTLKQFLGFCQRIFDQWGWHLKGSFSYSCPILSILITSGLSNFNSKQIEEIWEMAEIKPAVLQCECHPYLVQKKLINFCKEKGIVCKASLSFLF